MNAYECKFSRVDAILSHLVLALDQSPLVSGVLVAILLCENPKPPAEAQRQSKDRRLPDPVCAVAAGGYCPAAVLGVWPS